MFCVCGRVVISCLRINESYNKEARSDLKP